MSLLKTLLLPLALLLPPASGDGFLGVFLDGDEPIVTGIVPDSAAAKADLKVGDKFIAVDGKKTPDSDTFIEVIGSRDAGDRVRLDLIRAEKSLTVFVVLGKRPAEVAEVEVTEEVEEEGEEAEEHEAREEREEHEAQTEPLRARAGGRPLIGISLDPNSDTVKVLGVQEGGPAEKAGLEVGDQIVRLGRARIGSISDLTEALGELRPGQTVRIRVQRGDDARTLPLTLGRAGGAGGAAGAVVRAERSDEGRAQRERAERERAEQERERAEQQRERAEQRAQRERQRAEQERERAEQRARARAEREGARRAGGAAREASREIEELREELQGLRKEIRELKELVKQLNKGKK